MLRFDLDKLGWFEFESLCQTLLKFKLGLALEAWGDTHDWGRDAYYCGDLEYPTKKLQTGTFVFQCKFINGANATGAKADDPVLEAIKKECTAIKKRLSQNVWKSIPTVYTFLTNAKLRPVIRKQIKELIKEVLPDSQVISQDGKDICSLIDLSKGVARRFPQILGLRDLETLLSECINKVVIERSDAAIQEAKEISQVFVPTNAYSQAISVLKKHCFVVLEGPPEVGKTAIGRMIALSHLPEGWEIIECTDPKEILQKYDREQEQIFIADDFFGQTEYRPDRVRVWQDELPTILRKINKAHLLILTSRKHLLEMAKANLDVSGNNHDFPMLAEVLVNVSKMSKTEKALMLYRHMKNAGLAATTKMYVKKLANKVVAHHGFTPERIRELARLTKDNNNITETLVDEVLTNPTKRMHKAYSGLPVAHRWFMIAMLTNNHPSWLDDDRSLESVYIELCPEAELKDFSMVKTELSDAFIKIVEFKDGETSIEWVHPSCGDMMAEQLASNPHDRLCFLEKSDYWGLKYILSTGGGAKGEKSLPLLQSQKDWAIFERRILDSTPINMFLLADIYELLKNPDKHKLPFEKQQYLEQILKKASSALINLNNKSGWNSNALKFLITISLKYPQWKLDRLKNYHAMWLEYIDSVAEILESEYKKWHKHADLKEFISVTNAILEYDDKFLLAPDIYKKWCEILKLFERRGLEESSELHLNNYSTVESDDIELFQNSYNESKGLFEDLSGLVEDSSKYEFDSISCAFEELEDEIGSYIPPEPDYDDEDRMYSNEDVSVENLFTDL